MTLPRESSKYKAMKVVELKNIEKRDLAVDYRRVYTADAVLELPGSTVEKRIEAALEHSPLGHVDIRVSLLESLDYPLIPVLNALKTAIIELERKGKLS